MLFIPSVVKMRTQLYVILALFITQAAFACDRSSIGFTYTTFTSETGRVNNVTFILNSTKKVAVMVSINYPGCENIIQGFRDCSLLFRRYIPSMNSLNTVLLNNTEPVIVTVECNGEVIGNLEVQGIEGEPPTSPLASPQGTDESITSITGADVTGADVIGADVIGPGVTGADVTGPGIAGPDVTGPDVAGPDVTGPDVAGPDVTGPDVAGPDVAGPDVGIGVGIALGVILIVGVLVLVLVLVRAVIVFYVSKHIKAKLSTDLSQFTVKCESNTDIEKDNSSTKPDGTCQETDIVTMDGIGPRKRINLNVATERGSPETLSCSNSQSISESATASFTADCQSGPGEPSDQTPDNVIVARSDVGHTNDSAAILHIQGETKFLRVNHFNIKDT